jgi:hypothetical protein
MRATWVVVALVAACGGDDGGGMTTPDAAQSTFKTLIQSSWSLQPGTEIYQCATMTVAQDMYISELKPLIPLGTHHTVVSIGVPSKPDNPGYVCSDPFEFGGPFIYGTGVGSKPFVYPDGVALYLRAGQQVHINLHLYNTGDSVLTGTSGVEVKEVAAASVQHKARVEITGPNTLSIPPGISTQTSTCTISATEVNLLSFQPHMHQLGTHLTYTVTPTTGSPRVLYDQNYTFDGQEHVMIDPVLTLHAGDQVRIDCTYNNTTANTVTFGESSNDEMCLAGITMYPSTAAYCQ